MITLFVAFFVSLMVALVLTRFVRDQAQAWGWLDQANSSRKVHVRPIPRLGGVGIVGGFFAPLCALFLVDSGVGHHFRSHTDLVAGLFLGGAVIVALGLYDDLRGAGARLKFTVQFAVAFGLYAMGFRIDVIANPFGPELVLGALSLPFTVLWVVGVINALNLIDGLDGLAGGVAFFGVSTNFLLALARGDVLLALLMAALAGAILGFLVFNFNPASIFMGDTGSMFLGFVLAAVSIKTSTKSGTAVAMLVPVMALGLPIMDTLLAMVRRSLMGRPMFSADREHIHHRLMSRMVLSHRSTVLVLYAVCGLFGLVALALNYANSAESAMLLCCVGALIVLLMRRLGYLDLHRAKNMHQMRQRNLWLRTMVKDVTRAVRASGSLEAVWNGVRPLADALGLSRQELRFQRVLETGLSDGIVFEAQRPSGPGVPFEVSIAIKDGGEVLGAMLLVWRDGRSSINRDEELALEQVADAVAESAARLRPRVSVEPGRLVALRK
ncbi:Undecaprenyl-phosphate N-acetylglucosaminyl 1-phosphate transferase [Myxococcus hansupus]|uniref:Undecaprenyl-phosphate N-acetylglucosaminyl 1-phosphate transferase n=1 Tax=Pseudomyxococcus hansupus TaxID=1297742 RepID=A0A0H4X1K2_9BACT|nr:MraY family glycosyltransferase [Myxococcus hansupus]AKQ69014.1 Undecaprenyl-phosphate N-acetylglucosaminyl 1-phosphate transferase [Myxococcus hansupus]